MMERGKIKSFRRAGKQAVNPWEEVFRTEGRVFTEPHEYMAAVVERLRKRRALRVLDLGCGTGRHIISLSGEGFQTYGIDSSPTALDYARKWLDAKGLDAHLLQRDIAETLPFEESFFDGVISVQVIHHGTLTKIRKVISEVDRVLTSGGVLFVSVPRTRNQGQCFKKVEENTYIPLDGREKGLVHHYFTPDELRLCFNAFDIVTIHLDSTDHYCLMAYKRSEQGGNLR